MLFSKSDVPTEEIEQEKPIAPYRTAGSNRFSMGVIGKIIDEVLGELEQNESIHVPSRGNWSNHNMLEWILKKTGPAEVWITSWSISATAVETLIRLMESGQIKTIHALFDERIVKMCPDAHKLVKQAKMDMRMTKIHAKSIVVLNDDWGVSVTTSANFTRNPRIEKYVICSDKNIAEYDKQWIEDELKGSRPFEDDGFE